MVDRSVFELQTYSKRDANEAAQTCVTAPTMVMSSIC